MAVVDANVLLDLVTADPVWLEWSTDALLEAGLHGPLVINEVVYAELSVRIEHAEDLDAFLDAAGIELVATPRAGLFMAAKAYKSYRAAGGYRTGVLPDFFIGALAQALELPLLTRDVQRYRTYFPDVLLISPKVS